MRDSLDRILTLIDTKAFALVKRTPIQYGATVALFAAAMMTVAASGWRVRR